MTDQHAPTAPAFAPDDLALRLRQGEQRALARAISLAERGGPAARALLDALSPATGRAWVIGVTGPPGAGKSTLVSALVAHWRAAGRRVAVLAIDPSSPLSGGALLGDRIRMQAHGGDAGVFIRSMADRGRLGGIARATGDAVALCDAAGYDIVLVETVGAGQGDVLIGGVVHTTIVVQAPGMGDDVQALKAGILEIGDVLVVTKADRPGADSTLRELRAMLALAPATAGSWPPLVIACAALDGLGVAEVAEAAAQHHDWVWERRASWELRRADAELRRLVQEVALERALAADATWRAVVERVARRELAPAAGAQLLLEALQPRADSA